MIVATVIGTIVIVAISIAIGIYIDRRIRAAPRAEELREPPRRAAAFGPGETASAAIRATATQIGKLRAAQRCIECRAEMVAEPDDSAQLDGRPLVLLRFRCSRCEARRTIYVNAVASAT